MSNLDNPTKERFYWFALNGSSVAATMTPLSKGRSDSVFDGSLVKHQNHPVVHADHHRRRKPQAAVKPPAPFEQEREQQKER